MDRARAPLFGITACALFLRLIDLTRFELWVDEGATWLFAHQTLGGELGRQLALEPTPPVYYALVGVFLALFGDGDLVLRLPSVIFGTACIPAVYLLGRRLFGTVVGLGAAALLAMHPLQVFYSREARVYPLLLLLTILWLAELYQALDLNTPAAWGRFAAVLLAACAVHITGLVLGFASGVLILALGEGWRGRFRGLCAAALVGLLLVPWFAWTLPRLGESGAAWIVQYFYEQYPEEQQLARVLEQPWFGAQHPPYMRQMAQPPTPPIARALALLAQAGLLVAGALWGLRQGKGREVMLLFGGWLLLVLPPWILSHAWRPFFQPGRHDFFTLGALAVLWGVGLAALWSWRRRLLAGFAAATLLLVAAHRLYALHTVPAKASHRPAGVYLAQHADAEDQAFATGVRRLAVERYTRLEGGEVPFRSFPASTDEHPGWSDVRTLMEDQEALHQEARATVAALGHHRVFVLLRPYESRDGAVSATWLVDRHLLENLWAAGWQQHRDPAADALNIAIFEPPLKAAP